MAGHNYINYILQNDIDAEKNLLLILKSINNKILKE